jgi:hypothetical protein
VIDPARTSTLKGELAVETLNLSFQGPNLTFLLRGTSAENVEFAPTLSQEAGWAEENNKGGCKDSHDRMIAFSKLIK